MDKLDVLNATMDNQEHGRLMPMSLKISLRGQWHTVTLDRDDKNIQKTVRVLVMMMLRAEVEKAGHIMKTSQTLLSQREEDALSDYKVQVHQEEGSSAEIEVRAHSPLDARVMAFILDGGMCCNPGDPGTVIALAKEWTHIKGSVG